MILRLRRNTANPPTPNIPIGKIQNPIKAGFGGFLLVNMKGRDQSLGFEENYEWLL